MRLKKIRDEYDQNYQRLIELIEKMGGEKNIPFHREERSELYRQLRLLQRREHQLDAIENRLTQNGSLAAQPENFSSTD